MKRIDLHRTGHLPKYKELIQLKKFNEVKRAIQAYFDPSDVLIVLYWAYLAAIELEFREVAGLPAKALHFTRPLLSVKQVTYIPLGCHYLTEVRGVAMEDCRTILQNY